MRMIPLLLIGGLLASQALAADMTISQKGKQFDKTEITAKVGDRLLFQNDDTTAHNVHSATGGHRFDLGLQKPGDSTSITLDKSGTFEARCAIHPKMKLNVTVQ